MSFWLWGLIGLGGLLWLTYWGGSTAQGAENNTGEKSTVRSVVWFALGAILGPFGPLVAITVHGGFRFLDYEYSSALDGGGEAVRTLLNPRSWWHGGASRWAWVKSTPSPPLRRSTPTGARCHECSRAIEPFGMAGGTWTGSLDDLATLPAIQTHNGFVCNSCGKVSCPVCSGRKASERGVREFVCTACGHSPISTIYRG